MAANQERDFLAEAAALAVAARTGTLATLSGQLPHAALVTPALNKNGAPLLLISGLAAHTRNLRVNPACALLLVGNAADANPQTAPRLLLNGTAAPCAEPAACNAYLQTHPYAAGYAGFADFSIWLLSVGEAYYVGGFAAAAHLNASALQQKIKSRLDAGLG